MTIFLPHESIYMEKEYNKIKDEADRVCRFFLVREDELFRAYDL